ncbi:hypothetical protein CW304_08125 [Bacillus sp. UFRGS-B20]|nr:hypothetical protein CW304_08125 [Bacillus sp. UFRGS-B20]
MLLVSRSPSPISPHTLHSTRQESCCSTSRICRSTTSADSKSSHQSSILFVCRHLFYPPMHFLLAYASY